MSPAARTVAGKLADVTGPGLTERWGVTCADRGASVLAPNGTLVSVFGDTGAHSPDCPVLNDGGWDINRCPSRKSGFCR